VMDCSASIRKRKRRKREKQEEEVGFNVSLEETNI
jgi:hypothetical protein